MELTNKHTLSKKALAAAAEFKRRSGRQSSNAWALPDGGIALEYWCWPAEGLEVYISAEGKFSYLYVNAYPYDPTSYELVDDATIEDILAAMPD